MLVFFAKEQTLTQPASGETFGVSPDDQQVLPGVAEKLQSLHQAGAKIVVASNQGGVEAGHKSIGDAQDEFIILHSLLPQIDVALICPDFEGKILHELRFFSYPHEIPLDQTARGCHIEVHMMPSISPPGEDSPILLNNFRKPGTGMIQWGINLFGNIDESIVNDVIFIAGRDEDKEAAERANITFINAEAWRNGTVAITPGAIIF